MTLDPKPNLSKAGILANIDHYECRVKTAKDSWEQELQQLQYWLDQLELLQRTSDSVSL
jgi:hypothetical protein